MYPSRAGQSLRQAIGRSCQPSVTAIMACSWPGTLQNRKGSPASHTKSVSSDRHNPQKCPGDSGISSRAGQSLECSHWNHTILHLLMTAIMWPGAPWEWTSYGTGQACQWQCPRPGGARQLRLRPGRCCQGRTPVPACMGWSSLLVSPVGGQTGVRQGRGYGGQEQVLTCVKSSRRLMSPAGWLSEEA